MSLTAKCVEFRAFGNLSLERTLCERVWPLKELSAPSVDPVRLSPFRFAVTVQHAKLFPDGRSTAEFDFTNATSE